MRHTIFFSICLAITFIQYSCNEDSSDQNPQVMQSEELVPPWVDCATACPHDDIHISYLENFNCVHSLTAEFTKTEKEITFFINKGSEKEGITRVSIDTSVVLTDTIWLESNSINKTSPQHGSISHTYSDFDAIFGSFRIPAGEGNKQDYLIIDSFNQDTTILEGRFQCKFKDRFGATDIPDELVFICGSFKIERKE